MPPPDERAGSLCVYLVSGLLLLAIIGGGVFLVLYMILPESDGTSGFAIAGMLLVGTPWLFWTMTWLYRTVSMSIAAHGGRADGRAAAAAPAATGRAATAINEEDAAVDSPGGARRVRFGAATVLGGSQGDPGGGGGGDDSSGKPAEESGDFNIDCSSQASHESELPLFAKA